MNKINKCIVCGSNDFRRLFDKKSDQGYFFTLVRCSKCGLEFLSEVPDTEEIKRYYKKEYFTRRTERGYNDYFSLDLKEEIGRVFKLNLADLDFYEFEAGLSGMKCSLDIGCAAGYFVNFMQERGWKSQGVDISGDCVKFAVKAGLDVKQGDYLKIDYPEKFDLITLWATIEHLHFPGMFLEKVFNDLKAGGMLYLSTCRIGGVNFKKFTGGKWRFYNFPEHMYFFSFRVLKKLLEQKGFTPVSFFTYGSDFGGSGTFIRKTADFIAKRYKVGDMMVVSARKK